MKTSVEFINQTAYTLLEPLSLEKTYEVIVEDACKLVSCSDGFLSLLNPDTGIMDLTYTSTPELESVPFKKRGQIYIALQKRDIVQLQTDTVKTEFPVLYTQGFRHLILVPLFYKNKSIGVIGIQLQDSIQAQSRAFHTLKLFGALASLAIRKAQLYDQTAKAVEDRDFFISIASHELKTPLTTMHGYIQLLKQKITKHDPFFDWITKLYQESMRLTRMVDELFDMHKIKIDRVTYHFKPYPLRTIIDEAVTRFQRMYPKRKVEIRDERTYISDIVADYERLTQVLVNILENGAKFSPPATLLTIRLLCKKMPLC